MKQVWQERPLPEELLQYAVGDVRYLHQLADALNHNLPATVVSKVRLAPTARYWTRRSDALLVLWVKALTPGSTRPASVQLCL